MNEQESLKEYIDNTIKNGGEIRIMKDILSMQMKEGSKN